MAHEEYKSIGQKVHEQDVTAIDDAYREYLKNRRGALTMYASTLYSFRKHRDWPREYVALQLERLIPEMIKYAKRDNLDALHKDAHRIADLCDVLSTVLEYASNNSPEYMLTGILAAWETARHGFKLSTDEPEGGHTHAKLALTLAKLNFKHFWILEDKTVVGAGQRYLKVAEERAPHITDPNQKASVYNKLGFLWLTRLHFIRAIRFILYARSIPNVSPMTKSKLL